MAAITMIPGVSMSLFRFPFTDYPARQVGR